MNTSVDVNHDGGMTNGVQIRPERSRSAWRWCSRCEQVRAKSSRNASTAEESASRPSINAGRARLDGNWGSCGIRGGMGTPLYRIDKKEEWRCEE